MKFMNLWNVSNAPVLILMLWNDRNTTVSFQKPWIILKAAKIWLFSNRFPPRQSPYNMWAQFQILRSAIALPDKARPAWKIWIMGNIIFETYTKTKKSFELPFIYEVTKIVFDGFDWTFQKNSIYLKYFVIILMFDQLNPC